MVSLTVAIPSPVPWGTFIGSHTDTHPIRLVSRPSNLVPNEIPIRNRGHKQPVRRQHRVQIVPQRTLWTREMVHCHLATDEGIGRVDVPGQEHLGQGWFFGGDAEQHVA